MFLMGPLAQLKKMFEKGRIIATSIYIGALFLTLWMAVKVWISVTGNKSELVEVNACFQRYK